MNRQCKYISTGGLLNRTASRNARFPLAVLLVNHQCKYISTGSSLNGTASGHARFLLAVPLVNHL